MIQFTWKDHLRGMFGSPSTRLEMRIKHLQSLGYDDTNPMIQALRRILGEILAEKRI